MRPIGSRTVKTADFEQLADDEATGLFKAHIFGSRRSCHDETNQQKCPNASASRPPFPIGNAH